MIGPSMLKALPERLKNPKNSPGPFLGRHQPHDRATHRLGASHHERRECGHDPELPDLGDQKAAEEHDDPDGQADVQGILLADLVGEPAHEQRPGSATN